MDKLIYKYKFRRLYIKYSYGYLSWNGFFDAIEKLNKQYGIKGG